MSTNAPATPEGVTTLVVGEDCRGTQGRQTSSKQKGNRPILPWRGIMGEGGSWPGFGLFPSLPPSLFESSVAMWHDSRGQGTLVLTFNVREVEHIENSPARDVNMPARTVVEETTIFSGQRHSSREMLEGQTEPAALRWEVGPGKGDGPPQGTPSREAGGRQAVTAVRNWGRASAGLGSLLCKCEEIRAELRTPGSLRWYFKA